MLLLLRTSSLFAFPTMRANGVFVQRIQERWNSFTHRIMHSEWIELHWVGLSILGLRASLHN
jgi:hypothetical protein